MPVVSLGLHAHEYDIIPNIPCENTYESLQIQTLPGSNDGSNNKGQDIHLKVQEQLFDNAKKAIKDANQTSGQKGFRKFSKEFMSKLQSFGSNKEGTTLQAGISFSAVVAGKVATVELESSPHVDVDEPGSVVLALIILHVILSFGGMMNVVSHLVMLLHVDCGMVCIG